MAGEDPKYTAARLVAAFARRDVNGDDTAAELAKIGVPPATAGKVVRGLASGELSQQDALGLMGF
jgi:hypothetical protein